MAKAAGLLRGLMWVAGLLGGAQLAAADGIYLSFDQSLDDRMAVISADRGSLTFAAAAGEDEYERWGKLALMQSWTVAGARLKLGPSLRASSLDGIDIGLRLGADRYTDRKTWGQFWMVEYDSIQHAGLALASVNHSRTGLGVEESVYREAGDPIAPTVMGSWTRPGQPIALRSGWRFKDEEAFIGLSFSRFR